MRCVYRCDIEIYNAVKCTGCPCLKMCSMNDNISRSIMDLIEQCIEYGLDVKDELERNGENNT